MLRLVDQYPTDAMLQVMTTLDGRHVDPTDTPISSMSRTFVFPRPDDTLVTIAERNLPDVDDPVTALLGWNPHLAMRAASRGRPLELMCSDVVYTEPPA